MEENIKGSIKNLSITKNMIIYIVAMFVISICSQISIPMPNGVPMTLQTFSIALIGYMLTPKKSVKAVIGYLVLGAIGIPVFASGKFGISALLGLTGGFLFGFIPYIYCCSKSRNQKNKIAKVVFSSLGLIICHLFGILQYSILTNSSLIEAAMLVSIPFLLKDFVSMLFAYLSCELFNNKNGDLKN